ncbi:MAG TPA: sulfatase-like hydrolase/transferase [Vicinamibacteria bacterium]|nr:sulfatase-like hydrolase/transferase [Vicinamibacteria bacterium]
MKRLGSSRRSAILGACLSLSLWLWDLLSVRQFRFAGASDADVQERVLGAAFQAILALEVRLFLVHLAWGLLLGLATLWSLRLVRRHFGRVLLRPSLAVSVVTLSVHVSALLAMMGRYPQLFADRYWLHGGLSARLQRVITHGTGPLLFDAWLLLLLVALGLGTLLELRARLAVPIAIATGYLSRKSRAAVPAVGGLLGLLALALFARGSTASKPSSPDVLVLAADSLRADRLESSQVMPFAASLLPQASVYRYGFTPIARTYPSWVSTLTGTEPRQNGVRHMFPTVESREGVPPTFLTRLRDEGYYTFVVSDFAGDVFRGFAAGFETVDTPALNVDTLAASSLLASHQWTLPLLRMRWARKLFPVWRNIPSLADPQWLVDEALKQIDVARDRPYAGLVFFSTAHFPYAAPYPDYLVGAGAYEGPYLYHVPPDLAGTSPTAEDVAQVRARYDGALKAIDRAMERLYRQVEKRRNLEDTLLVIIGDHGEELYESPGIAGHGDVLISPRSQSVPILLRGLSVPRGKVSSEQVRLYDLGATVLQLTLPTEERPRRFGAGVSLSAEGELRPICVETGIWFWPGLPSGLVGQRLDYPGIADLLALAPNREMVLRDDIESLVETSKQRGLVLGNRLWYERLTPTGVQTELRLLDDVATGGSGLDLKQLFEERCVQNDPDLSRTLGTIIFSSRTKDASTTSP